MWHSTSEAMDAVAARGPRYAVLGAIRPGEVMLAFAVTAELAERERERQEEAGYRQVHVYPPVGAPDLAPLRRAREDARRALDDATSILRAGVVRALEGGRAEAEVARSAGVDRMTIRRWAGK
jgi:hypothetical protein